MRINTNILSLSAQRSLAQTTKALARSMERLASGKRINSARDDAAGLAVAERLKGSIRATARALLNVNESRGFIETGEGGLRNQLDLIHRMRELALQAANGTLSNTGRGYLDGEFQQLYQEIDRIATTTDFNGTKVIDGSFGLKTIQVGESSGDQVAISLDSSRVEKLFEQNSTSSATEGLGTYTLTSTASISTSDIDGMSLRDLDGDDDLDIFLFDVSPNTFQIYLNNGDGTFGAAPSQPTSAQNAVPILVDLNGDDVVDIAAGVNGNNTRIYFGNGDGTFQSAITFAVTGSHTIQTGDYDNDGDSDIYATTAQIFLNNGSGIFTYSSTLPTGPTGTQHSTTGDIDSDGDDDLIILDQGTGYGFTYLSNGNGTFLLATTFSGGITGSPQLSDFNNDGNTDLAYLASTTDSIFRVRMGNGDGSFGSAVSYIFSDPSSSDTIRVHDANNDGYEDLFAHAKTDGRVVLYLGSADGTFAYSSSFAYNGDTLEVGDLNEDGFVDFVVGSSGLAQFVLQDTLTTTSADPVPISITTQEEAEDVLEILDAAQEQLLEQVADLSALMNRLDSIYQSSSTRLVELNQSYSQISDLDYAYELAEFTRLRVLQQTGIAVVAQANLSFDYIMDLLRDL